jgi:hypothetical protein
MRERIAQKLAYHSTPVILSREVLRFGLLGALAPPRESNAPEGLFMTDDADKDFFSQDKHNLGLM